MSASGLFRRAAHGRKGKEESGCAGILRGALRLRMEGKKKARQSRALSAALRACVWGVALAELIFACDLESFLSYVGPLPHEIVHQYEGAAKRRHKTSPGMKGTAGIAM